MLMNKVGQVLLIHKPEMGFQQLIVVLSENVVNLYKEVILIGVQHDFYIRCCSCRLSVTQRLSHVVQELLTLPEHTSSLPDCNGVRVARSFVFCVMFCISFTCDSRCVTDNRHEQHLI
jgi:hypothetical protein